MIPFYEKIILILIEAVGSGILTMIPLDNKSEAPLRQIGKEASLFRLCEILDLNSNISIVTKGVFS